MNFRKHNILLIIGAICIAVTALLSVHAAITPTPLPSVYVHPHGIIPALHAEHTAIHSLVQDSQVTHRAIKSGDWSDATVWGGSVPSDGAHVVVPTGLLVDYTIESNADIATIRLDGALRFSRINNTKLRVDTLVITNDGALDLGRVTDPIIAKCEIVISGTNMIDPIVDPREIGKGIICQGYFYAYGKAKTAWSDLIVAPKVGDTKLTLEVTPTGWQVGDELCLAGTVGLDQHEILTLVSVTNNEVTFTPPLKFGHALKDDNPIYAPDDRFAFVQNLSRNIIVRSEVESYGMPILTKPWGMAEGNKRRGHIMLHTSGVSKSIIGYLRIQDMGRTDKRLLTSTPIVADDGTRTNKFGFEYWNPLGRYSLHLHRPGPTTAPFVGKGIVVVHDPGWGIAQHGANAQLDDCCTFDTCGAGFATEDGSERGHWRNCSVIKCVGDTSKDQSVVYQSEIGQGTGAGGIGFWTNSSRVKKEKLRTSACQTTGLFHWNQQIIQDEGVGVSRFSIIRESDIAEDEYLRPYFVDGRLEIFKVPFDVDDVHAMGGGNNLHFESNSPVGKRSQAKRLLCSQLLVGYAMFNDFSDSLIYGNGGAGTQAILGTSFTGGLHFKNVIIKGHPIGMIIPRNDAVSQFTDCTFYNIATGNATLAFHTGMEFLGGPVLRQLSFDGTKLLPHTSTGPKPKFYFWRPSLPATGRQWDYFSKSFLLDRILVDGKQALFLEQVSDFIPYPTDKLSTVGAGTTISSVPPQYRDKTNVQLYTEFGTCMAGIPMFETSVPDPVFGHSVAEPTSKLGIQLHSPKRVKPTSAYTLQVKAFKPGDVEPGALGYTVETIGAMEIKSGWNVLTFELPVGERHSVEVFGEETAPPPPPPPPTVASVTVTPVSSSIEIGKSTQLTAEAKDSFGIVIAGKTFTWTSSSTQVATVSSSGSVVGVNVGQTTITASVDGKSGQATVNIIAPPPVNVASVTISPPQATVEVGKTVQFVTTVKDSGGNILQGRTITWNSSSQQIASIVNGLATGKLAGQVKITATVEGVIGQAALTVTTAPVPPAKIIKKVSFDISTGKLTIEYSDNSVQVLP